MNDKMNELVQFSPVAGQLTLEKVPAETSKNIEFENEVQAAAGAERTMYCYAPKSGCPDAKQCQVLMVLRDDTDAASAERLLTELTLAALAEEEHFVLVFPNPTTTGWNYKDTAIMNQDMDYLMRCFDALRGSKVGVGGFNGMIFYLAATPSASALMMTMVAKRPANIAAMMLSSLPSDYDIPADACNVEVAAWSCDPRTTAYLRAANGAQAVHGEAKGITRYPCSNPHVKLLVSKQGPNETTVRLAWDNLFSVSRRWQNDTYGTYQPRTAFTARGFVPHVKDSSLGVNSSFPHTWYEYVPPQLRGSTDKVPLVFYFHGVNCVPLYGAEQSNWHDIADRDNFIVVYPAPSVRKSWNIWNEATLPSDFDFVLALIDHMQKVHPIDESRIYLSGFSMGGMMTHALAGAFPEVFAAAAPCNGFHYGYFKKATEILASLWASGEPPKFEDISYAKVFADKKKSTRDYRMPMIQNVGCDDFLFGRWPVEESMQDARIDTISYWKRYNNIATAPAFDHASLNGFASDEAHYSDADKRFFHQSWLSQDAGNPVLYKMVMAKRMAHAIVPQQIVFAWDFIKQFARAKDGSLIIDPAR